MYIMYIDKTFNYLITEAHIHRAISQKAFSQEQARVLQVSLQWMWLKPAVL